MTDLEVCPSCGAFVDHLQERTGWCVDCSRAGRSFFGVRDCSACGERRPLSAFSVDKTRKDGRRPVCRQCDSKARRERTQRSMARLEGELRRTFDLDGAR